MLMISVIVSVSLGSAHIPLSEVWGILLSEVGIEPSVPLDASSVLIVAEVRGSRVLLALLVGAALGLAGTLFQGVLRNPLADPFTLGVASGSSLGAATLFAFGLTTTLVGMWSVPIVAFASGALTLVLVMMLAYGGRSKQPTSVEMLILSGVIVQAFLSALLSFLIAISGEQLNAIVYWLLGSISGRSYEHVAIVFPFVLVAIPIAIHYARALNLLTFGEQHAHHLGVKVTKMKIVLLFTGTLLTAVAVSVSGVIGFVGLVIPHLLRLICGSDFRMLVPLSIVWGGIYVLWADTLARMLLSPQEIPLGVITSLLGTPIFAYFLWRQRAKGGV